MELRQVQLFLAAAEEGSITAAARKMNLTQPALSRQIKALEEELDVELFTRGAHSVALTAAGRVLVEEGKKLIERAERVVKLVRAESVGEPLRIGYAPSLAGPLLGLALERFSQVHPRARVQLYDCSSAEMRDGLAQGKFDVVVTVPWEGDGNSVQWTAIRRHPMRLAVPKSHSFAGLEKVKLSDLNGQRLLLFSRTDYPEYWQSVTKLFRDHGIDAKVAGEFDGVTSLGSAVEAGLGVALVAAGSRIEARGAAAVGSGSGSSVRIGWPRRGQGSDTGDRGLRGRAQGGGGRGGKVLRETTITHPVSARRRAFSKIWGPLFV